MNQKHEAFFKECLITSDSVDGIDFNYLSNLLEKKSFACIRGVVSEKQIKDAREALEKDFSPKNDAATVGEKPEDVMKNFQKFLLGGSTQSNLYLTRCFRTFYTPFWEEDVYNVHTPLKKLALVRNRLNNVDDNFAIDKVEENGMWTAARVHQFPTGGGFFSKHRDTVLIDVNKEKDMNFYQVILVMSKKGQDFDDGGGFIEIGGEDIDLDNFTELGDIIIYSSANVHGVWDIDPHKKLDLENINGRLTGFVSLYTKR